MNNKDIRQLVDLMVEKDIAEIELERGKEKIRIRRVMASNGMPPMMFASISPPAAAPALPPVPAAAPAPAAELPAPPAEEELHLVTSPIVGTFYDAPSPQAAPFVQIGDTVEAGQVLCIIEAMKLMNEIEADASGVVEKRFVSNQQPVEYGEALYGIRKK